MSLFDQLSDWHSPLRWMVRLFFFGYFCWWLYGRFGPGKWHYTRTLNERGLACWRKRKFDKAERILKKALAIRENISGPEHLEIAETVSNLALVYRDAGAGEKAEPLLQRALRIRERELGAEDRQTAETLENLGLFYHNRADYASAEQLLRRSVSIREKALGLDHPSTAYGLNNLGVTCYSRGDYAAAEELFQRVLRIHEKLFGPDHEETAGVLNNLAMLYETQGEYYKAEPLYQRSLHIREKYLGGDHLDVAESLNNLGILYGQIAEYDQAKTALTRALEIQEKAYGENHLETAGTLQNLAIVYQGKGDYASAHKILQRVLIITERAVGLDHPRVAACCDQLAGVLESIGDYSKALETYTRALRIRERSLGLEHPDTAITLGNLGICYNSLGEFSEAEDCYRRTLAIREKVFDQEHPDTATALGSLAEFYRDRADYAKAEPLYRRALEIREKSLGPEHPDTARSLSSLAGLYAMIGDYTKAESLGQRALQIRERALGVEHPDTAGSLNNLAIIYHQRGEYTRAESLYRQALQSTEKLLGAEHPDLANMLNNLAGIHQKLKNYSQAQSFDQRALLIRETALGPEHPKTAVSLNRLACLYIAMGEHAKAEALLQRALRIQEKALGLVHPDTAQTYHNLGLVFLSAGNQSEARRVIASARQAQSAMMIEILSFAPEAQRLAFQATQWPYDLAGTLGSAPDLALAVLQFKGVVLDSLLEDRLVAQASEQPEIRAQVEQLRALKHRITQLIFEAPKDLREQTLQRREEEKTQLTQEAEQLESMLARYVAGLGRARRSLSVTVEQVQAAIPKEAVLLEWLRYGHYLGKNQLEQCYGMIVLASSGEPKWVCLGSAEAIEQDVKLYHEAVRTAPKPEVQSPKWEVSASQKSEVGPLLRRLYEQLWASIETALPPETNTVIISPDGALNFLSFATLLTPDDRFLSQKYSIRYVASGRDLLREFRVPENKQVTVFANPDFGGPGGKGSSGSPNESTPDPSQEGNRERSGRSASSASLIARSAVDYASKPGRSSRREEALTLKPEDEVSLLTSTAAVRLREVEMRDFAGLHLPPLPGTARESALLAAQAGQWNWPMQVFDQGHATKSQLHAAQSPRILHLATHGFFLPDVAEDRTRGLLDVGIGESMAETRGVGGVRPLDSMKCGGQSASLLRPRGVLKNPMHRSGLALAGAQATLDAWGRGETPPSSDDGIVTAAEVGTLKLEGTDLVVLSACETGVGEAKSGEGVLGLRRGFIQAGAKNLLMTLWSVADEETAHFMAEFYDRFHASGDAPGALADAQRDWLAQLRRERGLREAVLLAGPFLLSSQGRFED